VPPHFDWLTSGSGFTRKQFLALWEDVARFVLK
jgi:triacylglycerol lipase